MPVLRPVLAWLAILVLAILNGLVRESLLMPNLSRPAAFAISGGLLSGLILVVATALGRWMGLTSSARAASVGLAWVALTLVFEFGLGGMQGLSWAEMLEPYTFKDGNVWPVVLLVTLIAPLVAYRARAARPPPPAT